MLYRLSFAEIAFGISDWLKLIGKVNMSVIVGLLLFVLTYIPKLYLPALILTTALIALKAILPLITAVLFNDWRLSLALKK